MPADPNPRHRCPGACGRSAPYDNLACRNCWRRLPAELRTRLLTAWRARQAGASDGYRRHAEALQATLNWYRANPLPANLVRVTKP